jgi:hypothetical protein
MRVVLGAWGLGAFAASRSDTWGWRFGQYTKGGLSIPPMSSVHAGMIEPFPFILCEKVYVDYYQFEFLSDRKKLKASTETGAYILSPKVADLLREFERAGIVQPVDYAALVESKIGDINSLVEQVLTDPDLARSGATSRNLWLKFLLSPGGAFHPGRMAEISRMTKDPDEYSGFISSSNLGHFADKMPGNLQLPKAGFMCGHDVFDAVLLLKVGEILNAAICDWQMYGPIYSHSISLGKLGFREVRSKPPDVAPPELQWYIPIPKSPEIDAIWKLRDDPWVRFLRDEDARKTEFLVRQMTNHSELLAARKDVFSRLENFMVNSYSAIQTARSQGVFVERPFDGKSTDADMRDGGRSQPRKMNSLLKDNESKEHKLLGEVFAICADAGQIFRPTMNSDWGIDGGIEFKDTSGYPTGHRLYLQLKSGDSHLRKRQRDGAEVFTIKNERHSQYWQCQAYPVMLVIRNSDGLIRWMDIGAYRKRETPDGNNVAKQVVFAGQPFDASNLIRIRDKIIRPRE